MPTIPFTIPGSVSKRTAFGLEQAASGNEREVSVSEVSVSPGRVSLTVPDVTRRDLSYWRRYALTGGYSETTGFGGQFRLTDDTEVVRDVVEVRPPDGFRPPLDRFEALPTSYSEDQIAPDQYTVSVTFARVQQREPGTLPPVAGDVDGVITDDTSGPDAVLGIDDAVQRLPPERLWVFDTERALVSLPAAGVGTVSRSGDKLGGSVSVTLRLTPAETAVFLKSFRTPEAAVSREVVGTANRIVDTTPNNVLTMEVVETPDGTALLDVTDDPVFVVQGWQATYEARGERPWRLSLDMVQQTSVAANLQPRIAEATGVQSDAQPSVTGLAEISSGETSGQYCAVTILDLGRATE